MQFLCYIVHNKRERKKIMNIYHSNYEEDNIHLILTEKGKYPQLTVQSFFAEERYLVICWARLSPNRVSRVCCFKEEKFENIYRCTLSGILEQVKKFFDQDIHRNQKEDILSQFAYIKQNKKMFRNYLIYTWGV